MDENEFFRRATLKIFSSLNIETAMKQCMDFLSDYIPVSGMFFILYDPDLNVARFLASILAPGFPQAERNRPVAHGIPGLDKGAVEAGGLEWKSLTTSIRRTLVCGKSYE